MSFAFLPPFLYLDLRKYLRNSPFNLAQKMGQPTTNCNRRFFNGFHTSKPSSITYQKSYEIEVGEVVEKSMFLELPLI
jgi:hypothetical protein